MPKKKKREFIRIKSRALVGGVCAGVAEYFDIDIVVVRLVWAFLLVPGGLPGLIPYVLLWIIMPSNN